VVVVSKDFARISDGQFAGKTAIVTGASRGLGLGIAQMLVDLGANVVVTGRHRDALNQAVTSLGPHALGIEGTVEVEDDVQTVVDTSLDTFGSLDLLVNNAAIIPKLSDIATADIRSFDKAWAVNVRGALLFAQAAWSASMRDSGGVILNVGSIGGLRPTPGAGAYGVSKAALFHLTRQLALELAPRVRVNAIAPAVIRGGINEGRDADEEAAEARTYPLQRLGKLDDVVAAARYLLSDDAGWITGHVLSLDGGALISPRQGASLRRR